MVATSILWRETAVITIFDGIPDIFIERYDAQFCQWAVEFRTRGRKVAIVFDVLPGQVPTMDVEERLAWSGAWLTADIEPFRGQQVMVIRPASDWDKNLIDMHCWNLKRVMLS